MSLTSCFGPISSANLDNLQTQIDSTKNNIEKFQAIKIQAWKDFSKDITLGEWAKETDINAKKALLLMNGFELSDTGDVVTTNPVTFSLAPVKK